MTPVRLEPATLRTRVKHSTTEPLRYKPVWSGHSKTPPKLVFKTDYCLMQVKSIAECSKGSSLQYFRPSLSYHLSLVSVFCLFLSGRLRFYCTFEWEEICPKEMTQFPLQDHVSIYTFRNEHPSLSDWFFLCFHGFWALLICRWFCQCLGLKCQCYGAYLLIWYVQFQPILALVHFSRLNYRQVQLKF